MLEDITNAVIGKIQPGCCRLTINGNIAIKTSNGYKYYNAKTGNLTDCSNFVLDICEDLFMLVPTRTLKPGYIILINGKPVYVLETLSKNRVKVMQYEDSSIKEVIPERHALLGRKFYGRIVSLFGDGFGKKGGGFFKNMLKLKMMGAMMGGRGEDSGFGGNTLPMMMLMNGGSLDGLFDGICGESEDDDDEDGDVTFALFNDGGEDGDEYDDEPAKPVKKRAKKPVKKARK